MTINKLIWICVALILVLLALTIFWPKPAYPETPDTLFVKEDKIALLCFGPKECYPLDYDRLHTFAKKYDLTPKPTPTPEPYYPHYPLQPQE